MRVDFGYGNQTVHALALQRDGKILVAGSGSRNWGATRDEFVVARLRPNGRLDRTFSRDGRARVDFGRTWGDWAQGLAVLRDGRIALVGSSGRDHSPSRMALALLRPSGTLVWKRLLRPTRRGGYATDVVQAPDGSLVVGGRSFDGDSEQLSSNWLLARFRLDGRLVASFGRAGFVITDFGTGEDWVEELALQRDGKVVAAGGLYGTQGLARYRLR